MKVTLLFFATALFFFAVQPSFAIEDISVDVEEVNGSGVISSDVFGPKGGYVHPFLTVSGIHSDNIYNTNNNTESDYISVISPGIWVAVPSVKEELLDFETSSVAPGGLDLSLDTGRDFKRYQLYFFYNPEIYRYLDHSNENLTTHKAEGMVQFNLRGGLTFELVDQYIDSVDPRGTGISTKQDKYVTNFLTARGSYDFSTKFELRADFSHFTVNYDAERNDYRDRDDDSWSAYVYYWFLPKTSIFAKYQTVDVSYDTNTSVDSSVDRFYVGLEWEVTAKSTGSIKAGSAARKYDNSLLSDDDDLIVELLVDYIFSPKTYFELRGFRQPSESNIPGQKSMLRSLVNVTVNYMPTARITCTLDLGYAKDDYRGELSYGGIVKERKDSSYLITPSVEYNFREWLTAKTAYYYIDRDSNFSAYDYSTNTFLVSLTAAI